MATEVLRMRDMGLVSGKPMWAAKYLLRDVENGYVREVTCMYSTREGEEGSTMVRRAKDATKVHKLCGHHGFSRDKRLADFLLLPYVPPGEPVPSDYELGKHSWDGDKGWYASG